MTDIATRLYSAHPGWRQRCRLLGVVAAVLTLVWPWAIWADFYVWEEQDGRRVISTIPRNGYTEDQQLRDAYNPNSIVYQHRRVRDMLSQHYEQRVMTKSNKTANVPADGEAPIATRSRLPGSASAPKEGSMNLRELIDLEKRGGRWQSSEVGSAKY